MALLAYNKTTSPLALAAGNPAPTLPASTIATKRGPAFDATSELKGLTAPDYDALQAQVAAGDIELWWTAVPQYDTGALQVFDTAGQNTLLVWAPNHPLGSNGIDRFTDWDELYAKIRELRENGHGRIYVEIWTEFDIRTLVYDPGGPDEETLTGYAEIPDSSAEPGGYWDLAHVWILSTYRNTTNFANLTFADNCRVKNLSNIDGQRLRVVSKSTINEPIELDGYGLDIVGARQELFKLTAAAKPLIKITSGYGGIWNTGNNVWSSLLGKDNVDVQLGPVFDRNGFAAYIETEAQGIKGNTLTNTGAATNGYFIGVFGHAQNNYDQPSAGALGYYDGVYQNMERTEAVDTADSPAPGWQGVKWHVTPDAGPVSLVIEAQGGPRGLPLEVIDVGDNAGTNPVTISSAGAELFEDDAGVMSATAVVNTDGGSKKWTFDGAGNWRLVRSKTTLKAAPESVAASGALSVQAAISKVTANTTAFTLADGLFEGQIKKVICEAVTAATATITPASFADGTSVAFDTQWEYVHFEWRAGNWHLIALSDGAVVA